uniref:Uncharacterized protein n=1 Tax=Caenorhabditis tropicalis TaxID=1561998 RepID=A0A1I7UF83_9PELO
MVQGGKQILNSFGSLARTIVNYITSGQHSTNTNNRCNFIGQAIVFLFKQILQLLRQVTGVNILIGLWKISQVNFETFFEKLYCVQILFPNHTKLLLKIFNLIKMYLPAGNIISLLLNNKTEYWLPSK